MTTDQDEFDLGAELGEMAKNCSKIAEQYRQVAVSLRVVSDALRSLNGATVLDPETYDRETPRLLSGTMAVAHGKNLCEDIDRITVDVLGRAGAWDLEVETVAARILEHKAFVPAEQPDAP